MFNTRSRLLAATAGPLLLGPVNGIGLALARAADGLASALYILPHGRLEQPGSVCAPGVLAWSGEANVLLKAYAASMPAGSESLLLGTFVRLVPPPLSGLILSGFSGEVTVRLMRILISLIIVALCVYYYLETHKEQPPPPAPVAMAAPKPTPRKVYYHSPLDAPAMPADRHSGTGYTSSNHGTNWHGSHLSDGQMSRTSFPDATPEPDDN